MQEKEIFNILYEDENGKSIKGKRIQGTRRIKLEDGRTYGHSSMSIKFKYIGKLNDKGFIFQRAAKQYE